MFGTIAKGSPVLRSAIIEQMRAVAEQQGKRLAALTDDLPLLDSGLDSLCIAILVATLDEQLGLDPFSSATSTRFPVTIGDFVGMYETAAG